MRSKYRMLGCAALALTFAAGCTPKYQYPPQGYPQQNAYTQPAPVAQQPTGIAAEKARMKEELELMKMRNELEREKKKQAIALRQLDQMAAQQAQLDEGSVVRLVPCSQEGMGGDGKYYRGLGIGESLMDEDAALKEAGNAARAQLAEKFMGVVENIMTDYNSKTNTPNGQQAREADLENALRVAGTKVLNDYFQVTCQTSTRTANGSIKWYVAGQIPVDKFGQKVASELATMKVKYNKNQLLRAMDAQLSKQIQQEQQARDQALELQRQSQELLNNNNSSL